MRLRRVLPPAVLDLLPAAVLDLRVGSSSVVVVAPVAVVSVESVEEAGPSPYVWQSVVEANLPGVPRPVSRRPVPSSEFDRSRFVY
jgi:hypothetical protein